MGWGGRIGRLAAAGGLALIVTSGVRAQPAAPARPDWKGLDWLIGAWTAEGGGGGQKSGGPQQGSGGFSFGPDAGGHVLVRHNFSAYPAMNGQAASRHEDLMVIAPEPAGLSATYWDDDGHTIQYAVSAPADGAVEFLSTDQPGPRYRLSYKRTATGLDGRFEVAPPNQPTRFTPYLTWSARRTK